MGQNRGKPYDPVQVGTLTPEQRFSLSKLNNVVGGQIGVGVPTYQGALAPGVSDLQSQGFGAISSLGTTEADRGRVSALTSLLDKPTYASPDQYMSFFDQSVREPAMRDFNKNVVPAIRFGGTTGDSGALNRALADAAGGLSTNLASQRSQYGMSGLDAYQRMLEGYYSRIPGATEGLRTERYNPIQAQLSAGDIQRGITGEQNMAEYQRWLSGQAYSNPWLSNIGPALGTSAFATFQPPGNQPTRGQRLFNDYTIGPFS